MSDPAKPLPTVLPFPPASLDGDWWKDQIICGDALAILRAMPAKCVHLAITSPPYNVGLAYDAHNDQMPYKEYLAWLKPFWRELKRVLVPGGRFALNVAPTSIKDFKPIHYDLAQDLRRLGFIMRTEILWYKQVMRRRTAWGSFRSPSNPHIIPSWEYVLVFSKGSWFLEGNKADRDITSKEFIKFSDGFWEIPPETRSRQPFLKSLYPPRRKGRDAPAVATQQATRKREGHPAPFPEELIYRLIKFYSYHGNVVLDPFGGIGTVAAVAEQTGRHFVHLDLSKKYCAIAAERVAAGMRQLRLPEAPPSHAPTLPGDSTPAPPKRPRGRPRKVLST
ncbi:site-specific DNA-methyltransferase [bacterium]|nr:site-specific DNA-methyltransferase [bacterium]